MNAFWLSALLGVVITAIIFSSVAANIKGKKALCVFFVFLLLAVCAVSVWFGVFKYSEYLIYCVCGIAVGIPVSAIVLHLVITYFGDRIVGWFKALKKIIKRRKKKK